MTNNNKEFFEFINCECMFLAISATEDGSISVKWKGLDPTDYTLHPPIISRINLRVQKTKDSKIFFLDCFQRCCGEKVSWSGFHVSACSHYEISQNENNDNFFDIVFYFDRDKSLRIVNVAMETVFVLQDFFSDFL